MTNIAALAEMGTLVGDPSRASMLSAPLDGRALTARELAECAGITAQTANGHLGKLLAAGMLSVEQQGRHRYHRLASPDIADMLEMMHVAGTQLLPKGTVRTGPGDRDMRFARSCYDHIAGRLGVALANALCERSAHDLGPLSASAKAALTNWGWILQPCARSSDHFAAPASIGVSGGIIWRALSVLRCSIDRCNWAGCSAGKEPARCW